MKKTCLIVITAALFFCQMSLHSQSKEIKILGFVTDSKTNERLLNVMISIDGVGVTESNENGYFEFFLPKGKHKITAQLLGYEKQTKELDIIEFVESKKLFFKLLPKDITIEEVTVSGDKFSKNKYTKTYELTSGDLQRIPQFGEPDALRALQALPGITSINDFSTQLFVKGGNFDETLISLDNAPVYNPYHLGGIFSMFTSEIVSDQKLYPINYPSKYGDYLSSVLEISTKDGNRDKIKGSISLSMISSSLFIDAPIGKGSIIFSARRTYLDILTKLISVDLPYYFYDIYTKYTRPIDKKSVFSISYFYSKDVFEVFNDLAFEQPKIMTVPVWGNNVLNFNYVYLFSPQSALDVNLYYSNSFNRADASSIFNNYANLIYLDNNITDFGGKIKYNFQLTGQKFEIGLELKNIGLDYNWEIGETELNDFSFELENSFYDFAENPYQSTNNFNSFSAYASDDIIFTKEFSAKLGARLSYLSNLDRIFLSPSVKVNYSFNENLILNFSYGKYYQNLYVVKDQGNPIFDPFSVYFTPRVASEIPTSDNFSLGFFFLNIFKNTRLEVEAYYKKRQNLASSYNKFVPFQLEDGYSRGIDVFLKKEKGFITGWMSYTWAQAVKTNDKYSYYARYDRTHTIKALADFGLSETWHISMFWTYATGLPYTRSVKKFIGNREFRETDYYYDKHFYWNPAFGRKNSSRAPDYHRLDIGINGSFIFGSLLVKPFLQVLNVYNSSNEIFFIKNNSINKIQTVRGSYLVPTVGLTIEF
ncbi:MAG: TonB-dependent receptor [Melioribacteraceae bacterium]|nr:TonB-dependent receptor [Melioribacteraceae bacterium]